MCECVCACPCLRMCVYVCLRACVYGYALFRICFLSDVMVATVCSSSVYNRFDFGCPLRLSQAYHTSRTRMKLRLLLTQDPFSDSGKKPGPAHLHISIV